MDATQTGSVCCSARSGTNRSSLDTNELRSPAGPDGHQYPPRTSRPSVVCGFSREPMLREITMLHRYRINGPTVVAEVIDGEAVIMHLKSGYYYSAVGAGCFVWEEIAAGKTPETATAALRARYDVDGDDVQSHVAAFLAQLTEHDLIVPQRNGPPSEPVAEVDSSEKLPYSPPVLDVFTDMEDLLLLDPIHDVGEAGWPMPISPDTAVVAEGNV